jgi:hypothetical protein
LWYIALAGQDQELPHEKMVIQQRKRGVTRYCIGIGAGVGGQGDAWQEHVDELEASALETWQGNIGGHGILQ